MKQIYNILFLLVFLSSCGQKKEQLNNTEEMQTALIEKYTEKIWSEMKQYEVQPAYYLRLYQTNCTFEVYVNGIRAHKGYGLEKLGSAVFINRFILKSGKQEVTVRMYPLGTLLQEEYGEENYDDILELLTKSNVEVKVTHISDLKTYQSPSQDEKTLLVHNSPVDNQKEFVGKRLPYYEYSFDFEAEVPYEFEGWSNSVDLRTVDQQKLKEQFSIQNDRLRQMYLNKECDNIMTLFFKNLVREFESMYYTKEEIINEQKILFETIYNEKKIVTIEDQNLDFDLTANNKLISQWITKDLIRSRTLKYMTSRGFFSILFLNKEGEGEGVYNYFYMPKEYEGKEIHLEYIP